MKSRYFLGAFVSACVIFTGCSDDVLEENKNIPWQEGDGIVFGARAGFENADKQSRTIYTGKTYTDKDGHTYEGIDWIPEVDSITILSPQASSANSEKFADYKIESNMHGFLPEDSQKDYATLVAATPGKALQWGSSEDHQFYACYPTQASTTKNGRSGIKMEQKNGRVLVTGTIPNNQIPHKLEYVDIKDDSQNSRYQGYVARPVMRNAHMVAYSTHAKSNIRPVDLTFKSIITALEVDLVGAVPEGTTIIGAMIGSKDPNQKLVGDYQCEINESLETGYPKCNNISQNVAVNQIYIPLVFQKQPTYGSNTPQDLGFPRGVVLKKDQHLKFTAFILPTDGVNDAGLKDITLTLISLTGRKQHVIPIAQDKFKAHLKHYVNNVKIPTQYSSSNWMSRLDGRVKVDQLSIPGSGNSYSKIFSNDTIDGKYFQTQVLDIDAQWNYGVRCFEITSDRASKGSSLGNVSILGAGRSTATSIDAAVNAIYNKVSTTVDDKGKPTEFAIIIMNYQPTGSGATFTGRDAKAYTDQAVDYISRLTGKKIVNYRPGITLSDVRGGLMFVLRPTSDGEDMWDAATLNRYATAPCVIVNGWGSLQDKWKQRGYANVTCNSGKEDLAHAYERFMLKEKIVTSPNMPAPDSQEFNLPVKGTADYTYKTNIAQTSVWAQEWNRVIEAKKVKYVGTRTIAHITRPTEKVNLYAYWAESYTEKLKDAEQTFNLSVSGQHPNMLFINCLTGYFVDFDAEKAEQFWMPNFDVPGIKYIEYGSHNGGKYGLVIPYANRINEDFYQFMWERWNTRLTAPMGIVMMNRIGDDTTDANGKVNEGNLYMPNMVISNNFSFKLELGTPQTQL